MFWQICILIVLISNVTSKIILALMKDDLEDRVVQFFAVLIANSFYTLCLLKAGAFSLIF